MSGDWEWPVLVAFYWDGKRLRGLAPRDGNVWNPKNGKAIGNYDPDDEGPSDEAHDGDVEALRAHFARLLGAEAIAGDFREGVNADELIGTYGGSTEWPFFSFDMKRIFAAIDAELGTTTPPEIVAIKVRP